MAGAGTVGALCRRSEDDAHYHHDPAVSGGRRPRHRLTYGTARPDRVEAVRRLSILTITHAALFVGARHR